jgi:hypothetical protein
MKRNSLKGEFFVFPSGTIPAANECELAKFVAESALGSFAVLFDRIRVGQAWYNKSKSGMFFIS